MTNEQRNKAIKVAAGAGLLGIAGALTQLQHGEKVDCSLKAACGRLLESARSEYACLQTIQRDAGDHGPPSATEIAKAQRCVAVIDQGYQETRAACPVLDVPQCSPFTHPERGFLQ